MSAGKVPALDFLNFWFYVYVVSFMLFLSTSQQLLSIIAVKLTKCKSFGCSKCYASFIKIVLLLFKQHLSPGIKTAGYPHLLTSSY